MTPKQSLDNAGSVGIVGGVKIPKRFYAGKHPTVQNVGELKALLEKLPDDLPIRHSFEDGVKLIVWNYGEEFSGLRIPTHLGFESVSSE